MILVTVGTQLAFDRMVHTVDAWARDAGRSDVFAQIGDSKKPPAHIEWARSLEPAEFKRRLREADVIIGHTGMGTILSALEFQRPLLVMPRRAELREHRNDHQLATAERLAMRQGITVAMDEQELRAQLDRIDEIRPGAAVSPTASPELIDAVRSFVRGDQASR